MISALYLSAALCSLGNRLWGEGKASHIIGLMVMSLGVVLHSTQWWHFPMFALTIFLWRFGSTRPWNDLTTYADASYWLGVLRGLYIIPYAIARHIAGASIAEYYLLLAGVFIVPTIYWLTSKQHRVEPVALAEFCAGALLGL